MSTVDWSKITVALSIRQPWAWLIVNGFKDLENRDWPTRFRGPVLIHAGKRFGPEERAAVEEVRERFGIALPESFELGGVVGGAVISDCVPASPSPWFVGVHGFMLEEATPLPFRPLPGRLGFFNVCGDRSFMAREVEG